MFSNVGGGETSSELFHWGNCRVCYNRLKIKQQDWSVKMKFYIATSLSNWVSHNKVRDALTAFEHEISYDWTLHGKV